MTEEEIIRMAELAVVEMAAGTDDLGEELRAAGKNVVVPRSGPPEGALGEDFARYVFHFVRLSRERFGKGALEIH
jgi:hypothetical protein